MWVDKYWILAFWGGYALIYGYKIYIDRVDNHRKTANCRWISHTIINYNDRIRILNGSHGVTFCIGN